jgi:hypothetical protein
MSTSVGMKSHKKQHASSPPTPPALQSQQLEYALLKLDEACVSILDRQDRISHSNIELRYWQQRLENIAAPVSLAVAECKQPRRFYDHERGQKQGAVVLRPSAHNPLVTLAHVCEHAYSTCRGDLATCHQPSLDKKRMRLEAALHNYIALYKRISAS